MHTAVLTLYVAALLLEGAGLFIVWFYGLRTTGGYPSLGEPDNWHSLSVSKGTMLLGFGLLVGFAGNLLSWQQST